MSGALLTDARRALGHMPAVLEALLSGLDDEAARTRPAPDEWSPVEIVCHLRDEETEDFGARVRVILEGAPQFVKIDPERWAVERRYREAHLPEALAAFRARREDSLRLLASAAPEPLQALAASRPLGRLGPLSGLDLVAAWVATTASTSLSSRLPWPVSGRCAGRLSAPSTRALFPTRR